MDSSLEFKVKLVGLTPILFDRYSGSNEEELAPEKKVYLAGDGSTLVLPALNISSFLSSENGESAPKRICGKKWKVVCHAALSFVTIQPLLIPFSGPDGGLLSTASSQLHIVRHVARMKKGTMVIPNPKVRPQLDPPWQLSFTIALWRNPDLHEDMLARLFVEGGRQIGLGTWRGLFGKFEVAEWERI